MANNLVLGGSFDPIRHDLIKITSPFIINSYVAVALFSTMLAFFIGIFFDCLFEIR